MSNHFISIIVPAHNEENYIEKTLISVLNSSYKNFELIVACDSCKDNTEQIAKKYTDKIFSVNFKDTSKTRNHGAEKAKGNILVFLDADTLCSGDYLSSIVKAIDSGFHYGSPKMISESGTKKGKHITKRMNSFNKNHKTVGGNCFVTKEHFLKINGFEAGLKVGEDSDIGYRLRKNGAEYIFIENSHVVSSERRFKDYWHINFFSSSPKEAFLYYLTKRKYRKFLTKS